MTLLVAGVALWTLTHLFRRLAPETRARLGDPGKGLIALLLVGAVVLMVLGYRAADGAFFWGRSPMLVGINNLLMLVSVYLFAVSGMQTALARKMRHPMLGGVKVWALAHLLVNGDVPSFVLFGGLIVWAVLEMILINRAEPDWTRPAPKPAKMEIFALIGTVLVYGALAGVHIWLGYPTFG